jgi:ribosomal silencing factor RsfS
MASFWATAEHPATDRRAKAENVVKLNVDENTIIFYSMVFLIKTLKRQGRAW